MYDVAQKVTRALTLEISPDENVKHTIRFCLPKINEGMDEHLVKIPK